MEPRSAAALARGGAAEAGAGATPVQPGLARDAAGPGGLCYAEIAPPASLAGDVACFWTIESAGPLPEPFAYRIVPDGCIDVVFDLSGSAEAWLYGAIDRPLIERFAGRVRFLGVRLRPGRLGRVLGRPGGSLAAGACALDDVLGRDGRSWRDEMASAGSTGERVAAVTRRLVAMRAMRREAKGDDALAVALVDAIVACGGSLGAGDLAARASRSTRQVVRLCHAASGFSPKRLSRIVRFQRALGALAAPRPGSLAAIAVASGYADQAHLANEFRRLAGMAPGALMRAVRMSDSCKTAAPGPR